MRMTSLWVCALAVVVGCADEEPPADPYKCIAAGGAGCFELPTMAIAAYKADPDGDGPLSGMAVTPVLDCAEHEITTGSVTFTGKTVSLVNAETVVPMVRIEAFSDLAMGNTIGDVTSDDLGEYSLTIPNTPSVVFGRVTASGQLPFLYLYQRIDVSVAQQDMFNFLTATKAQIATVIELAGTMFLGGKSQVAAVAVDCAGNRLVNVVGNVSTTSGASGSRGFEDGVRVFYQIAGSVPVLARRTEQMQTTTAGGIALTNLSAGRHFVQIWGYPTESDVAKGSAGLRLISEREVIVPTTETGLALRLDGRL